MFILFFGWGQDFIWYDQQGNGDGGRGGKTGLNAEGTGGNSLIKNEKRTAVCYSCTLNRDPGTKKERPQALFWKS
ncbi:hypothetical protein [Aeromonas intestinalis]